MEKKDFVTPPGHTGFRAKKLFAESGTILDGAIACLEPGGGGPQPPHTHEHDHLFIVVKGEAKIVLDDRSIIVKENDSFLVEGRIPHAVWNNAESETVMIGITVRPR